MQAIRETLVNRDTDTAFSDSVIDADELILDTPGDVYRYGVEEYGRCTGKVYIDGPDGQPRHVGWTFLKRDKYADSNDTYLREAWVTIIDEKPQA